MKNKTLLLSLLLCFFMTTEATVRTVSNNAASPGQYNNLQTAVSACAVGDTIYLQASSTSYGDVTINKRLTIVGAGYAPDSTNYNLPSKIDQLMFDSISNVLIGNSKFIGLSINSYLTYAASSDLGWINNITFERCLFNSYVYISGNNWTFLNCIFNGNSMDINSYSNILMSNCIFISFYLYDSNKSSVNIYNSLFLDYTGTNMFSSVSYIGIYNSIFWNNSVGGCTSCSFINNQSYDDGSRLLPPSGNSGSGNISEQDPQFVGPNFPATDVSIPYADLKKYDWHLKSSSPGYTAGTDGKQLGIYGGSLQYMNLTGMYPQIPVVKSFIIKNPVAQKNGKLNISVKAEKKQ
jgi:hypothetical protein